MPREETAAPHARDDRLLRLIAIERGLRGIVLVALGAILVSHTHTDWGSKVSDFASSIGFDPRSNGVHRLVNKVHSISPHDVALFGLAAIAYGVLEGVESYGLWHRRRWAEYLTVVATSLLLIPEVYELTHRVSLLKAGGLVVNIVIVIYLIVRLRRHEDP